MKRERKTAWVLCLFFSGAASAFAQAPGLIWSTKVGARVFAVDNQTNVYGQSGGNVIVVNGSGSPVRTNSLSGYPGMAQRDSAGDIYYAGTYPGVWNGFQYNYVSAACFLAKFDADGEQLWSVDFGPTGLLRAINIKDLETDADGNVYVGYTYNLSTSEHTDMAAKFTGTGSNLWSSAVPGFSYIHTTLSSVRFGPASSSGGLVLSCYTYEPSYITLSRFDASGTMTPITNWIVPSSYAWITERPIGNSSQQVYEMEANGLVKRSSAGNLIWTRALQTLNGPCAKIRTAASMLLAITASCPGTITMARWFGTPTSLRVATEWFRTALETGLSHWLTGPWLA